MPRIAHELVRPLRSGSWLTRSAVLSLCVALLSLTILVVVNDVRNHTLGGDFGHFYAVSRLLRQGRIDAILSPPVFTAVAEHHLGKSVGGLYLWPHPPTALLLFYPLGSVPFVTAYAIAMVLGLAVYVSAVLAIVPGRASAAAALAFPGVAITLNTGQTSFLTAGLMGWCLLALPRRPVLAGVLAGLLTFKPHLAVLLPIAFVAGRHWRALAAAAVTAVALATTSLFAFGLEPWVGFIRVAPSIRKVLEVHSTHQGYQSVLSAIRLAGGDLVFAYAAQLSVAALVAGVVAWTWRGGVRRHVAAPMPVLATLLATPYLWDYDYMLMAIALAFTIRDAQVVGWRDWERSAIAAAVIVILVPRTVRETLHVSPAPAIAAWLLWLAVRRAREASGADRTMEPLRAPELRTG
jgi:hypothetical protein